MKKQQKFRIFVKDCRINAGLSQQYVAEKLGYNTPQFISNWERGVSFPPIKVLKLLAGLYGIDPEVLYTAIEEAEVELVTQKLRREYELSRR